jgi:AraC family transcriptional regulator
VEWTTALKKAIAYIESHLKDEIDAYDVAKDVYISPYYFQKGFSLVTGYTIAEYIRNRRLYLAALELIRGDKKVIDVAYEYGYETPESFTKAFARFHGVSPLQIRNDASKIKPFLPLQITIKISGGSSMDYKVEKMESFKVIGFERVFSEDNSYQEIPKFWEEFCTNCMQHKNSDVIQSMIEKCMIGEFGICIDNNPKEKKFTYMIAGKYDGGKVPEGMSVFEVPATDWAKFRCVGPLPGAIQAVNTEVFKTWLPGNPDYEMSASMNIEWYSKMDGNGADYESAIWVPVKKLSK